MRWKPPPVAADPAWTWHADDVFDRPWTLLTAPLVHLSVTHLLVNLLALLGLVVLSWGIGAGRRPWIAAALAGPPGLLALAAWPDLPRYAGLSGLLHGLAAALVVDHLAGLWRNTAADRAVTVRDALVVLVGAGLLVKLSHEAAWDHPVVWDPGLEIPVITAAHLSATIAGCIVAVLCARRAGPGRGRQEP